MAKLNIEDLKKIKDKYQAEFSLRDGGYRAKVTVHMGTCGLAAGARDVMDALVDEVSKSDAKDVIVTTSGCAGFCSQEPMATVEIVEQSPVKYIKLDKDKIARIFKEHVMDGNVVEEYAVAIGSETSY